MLCRGGKGLRSRRREEIGVDEDLVVRGRAWPCVPGLLPSGGCGREKSQKR